jgi:hypothetical protein
MEKEIELIVVYCSSSTYISCPGLPLAEFYLPPAIYESSVEILTFLYPFSSLLRTSFHLKTITMHVPTTFISLGLLALIPCSNAAALPVATTTNSDGDATPVEFNGVTIYVNTAAMQPTTSANPAVDMATRLRKRTNYCGDSTFVNHSSGGSPLISDCVVISDYAAATNDGWKVDPTPGYNWILRYGTCQFGATTANILPTSIGNEDIRDLMRDSYARFSWNGLVGAEGNMGCVNFGTGLVNGYSSVNWAIYHT